MIQLEQVRGSFTRSRAAPTCVLPRAWGRCARPEERGMFVGTCACGNNIKGGQEPGSSHLWHQACAADQNQDWRRSSEALSLPGARSVPGEGCRAWMKGQAMPNMSSKTRILLFASFPKLLPNGRFVFFFKMASTRCQHASWGKSFSGRLVFHCCC